MLPPLAGLLTGFTVAILNIRHAALGLEPVLEGLPLTGNLEDIEGLPFIVFCVALITLNCLAHHAEEEIHHRADIPMRKGRPAI